LLSHSHTFDLSKCGQRPSNFFISMFYNSCKQGYNKMKKETEVIPSNEVDFETLGGETEEALDNQHAEAQRDRVDELLRNFKPKTTTERERFEFYLDYREMSPWAFKYKYKKLSDNRISQKIREFGKMVKAGLNRE
jgi:hypothetical protein